MNIHKIVPGYDNAHGYNQRKTLKKRNYINAFENLQKVLFAKK